MACRLGGTTGEEKVDGFLASVKKIQRFLETCPLPLSRSPMVGTSHMGTLAERDRDLPKVTLSDPLVRAEWSRAPGPAGMSGATQSPEGQLFPDWDFSPRKQGQPLGCLDLQFLDSGPTAHFPRGPAQSCPPPLSSQLLPPRGGERWWMGLLPGHRGGQGALRKTAFPQPWFAGSLFCPPTPAPGPRPCLLHFPLPPVWEYPEGVVPGLETGRKL